MKKFKGGGDVLEFIFKWTGIKFIVSLFVKDCGCNERREKINVILPFD